MRTARSLGGERKAAGIPEAFVYVRGAKGAKREFREAACKRKRV